MELVYKQSVLRDLQSGGGGKAIVRSFEKHQTDKSTNHSANEIVYHIC